MGKFLEFVFNRFFLGMIATAFFWLFTLAGGVVFGLAPASATLMSLYAEHGYTYRAYSLKEAWELYKSNFVKSNLAFYSFVLVDLVLVCTFWFNCPIKLSSISWQPFSISLLLPLFF